MEDTPSSGAQNIDKKELKQGYVLFQDIPALKLKAGYVLSDSDIEKIIALPNIDVVTVLIQEKNEIQGSGTASVRHYTKEDLENADIDSSERDRALFDVKNDTRLREVINIKKDLIRGGVKYEQRFEEHKRKKLSKFHNVIKSIHGHQKDETLKVIDDYAKVAADIDGIEEIESAQTIELVRKLDKYERNAEFFLKGALSQRRVFTSFVEEIVVDFINDVGYSLARALFTGISKIDKYKDFLAAHSLQVMIVALITAIEMTKMIKEKSDLLASSDINTFLAISKKFFSLEELINLGVAALLHDIEIKNKIPDLAINHKLGFEWDSIISLHPSNGFHLCKKINMDFDIQRSVYQHHERFDGSGYPNGLLPRFFSKYTPIVMFAENYVELTTFNPFVKTALPPRIALVDFLSRKREQFDGDVIYSFIRAASLFPVGSWLLLSDGHIGIVSDVNKDKLDKPVITVFFDKNLERVDTFDINLAEEDLTIVKPIDLPSIKKLAGGSLNFIFNNE
jgi:HD-GYP domain-containing protein (c-di-GMP phosphodiesterase class II)